jgi:hypothetical protein
VLASGATPAASATCCSGCDRCSGKSVTNTFEAVRSVDVSRRHGTVATAADDGCVIVSVSDRGIGFPADQIDRMFEPFFTTTTDGMRLGLSICRTIIDAHGGRISASHNPDNGLTCRFSLAALAPACWRSSRRTRPCRVPDYLLAVDCPVAASYTTRPPTIVSTDEMSLI